MSDRDSFTRPQEQREVSRRAIAQREVARRIFAREFNDSNLQQGEGMERSPNFIVTPTGVVCNRIFIVGVLTEVENIGSDGQSMYRARVADPTGVFTVYAGEYQPAAAIFLSSVKTPAYVAVVGKARVFAPEKSSFYVSIRPEEISLVDEYVRNRWIYHTAHFSIQAMKVMEKAMESGLRGAELARHISVFSEDAPGIAKAIDHYALTPNALDPYKRMVIDALATIVDASLPSDVEAQPSGDHLQLAIILDMIGRMDKGEGVSYEALLDETVKHGYSEEEVERAINSLMDGGRCYEPRIGILKLI